MKYEIVNLETWQLGKGGNFSDFILKTCAMS